jgi:hypothetical protein
MEERESSVEGRTVKWAQDNGYFVRKVAWIGRRGAQDRLFLKDGRYVWLEFKRRGKMPTEGVTLQTRNKAEMMAHGAECYFVDSFEDARRILLTPP